MPRERNGNEAHQCEENQRGWLLGWRTQRQRQHGVEPESEGGAMIVPGSPQSGILGTKLTRDCFILWKWFQMQPCAFSSKLLNLLL